MPNDPSHAVNPLEHAANALDRGAFDAAEQGFRVILASDPQSPAALLLLG